MGFRRWVVAGGILLAASAAPAVSSPLVSVSTYTVESSSPVTRPPHFWRMAPNNAFLVGEELRFALKWGVIKGGHSTLSIPGTTEVRGRPAYHILSEARTVGLADLVYKTRDRNETWLDEESLLTVKYEKHIREGRYRVETVVEMDQAHRRFREQFERLDRGTTDYLEGDLPPDAMDVLGSLYYVRTLPLAVGQSYTLDVYDSKKVWPLVVNVIKREKVKVPAGKFDCFKVEPVMREPGIFIKKGKRLEVWLTADERKMPVLMRSEVAIGHVSAELVKFHHTPEYIAPSADPPSP